MRKIKKLTLRLKSSLLSELHSDTVMGHFCWRLKEKYGEEKLKEFISFYQKSDLVPPFTISNGLFEKDYWDSNKKNIVRTELFFQRPFIHIKNSGSKPDNKRDKINDFIINKELKSIELLTTDQFNLAINGKTDELYEQLLNDKLERPKFITDLRVSVAIDRKSLSAKKGQLFSYHPKFIDKDTRIVFLLKVLNEEAFYNFNCEEVLRDVFEIGYGKKKSSGYGQFEVVGNIEFFDKIKEPPNTDSFIILGNYLPSVYDGINGKCRYDFIVKYGRLGEEKSLSDNPFKKSLILFTAGSVFKTSIIKEFYGQVTQSGDVSEFDLDVVHFGIPFTLRFNLVT